MTMKTGKTLPQLAAEIARQQAAKRDFVVSANRLAVDVVETFEPTNPQHTPVRRARLLIDGADNGRAVEAFPINDYAHGQLATKLDIPAKFYDRIQAELPDLWQTNVNRLISHKGGTHLVRTLDNNARAVLSNKYRRLDNVDLIQAVLPTLNSLGGGLRIESAEITDRRLYIKAVYPKMEMEVKKGDPVQAGIVISNSEIGAGRLMVQPLIYRLVCTNGMISEDGAVQKYHIGRGIESEMQELLSSQALNADDRAYWLKARDVVKAVLTDAKAFGAIVDRMSKTTRQLIESTPTQVVELTAKTYNMTESESAKVLEHLLTGGDTSRYGLLNAVTRTAQDVADYDRATELESIGGDILNNDATWKRLAVAA
jgi:hypothetical protein